MGYVLRACPESLQSLPPRQGVNEKQELQRHQHVYHYGHLRHRDRKSHSRRTQENLASSDKAILACRKLLLKAIRDLQAGREPPHVIREPNKSRLPRLVVISEIIPSGKNWREHAREREAEVRI